MATNDFPVGETITGPCPPYLGFSAARFNKVAKQPDDTHEIQYGDLQFSVRVKHQPKYTELIVVQVMPQRFGVFACCINQEWVATPLRATPSLELLKSFIGRFGLTIRIGEFQGQLLISQKIPSGGAAIPALLAISNPLNHALQQHSFISIDADTGAADVALAFCIDMDHYANAIRGR